VGTLRLAHPTKTYLAREPQTVARARPARSSHTRGFRLRRSARWRPLGGRERSDWGGPLVALFANASTNPTTWPTARPYLGHICSLCCSLDARCNDMCKPHASWSAQVASRGAQAPAERDVAQARQPNSAATCCRCARFVPLLGMLFYMIYPGTSCDQLSDAP